MLSLTPAIDDLLVGVVIGDGRLQSTGRINARLRLEHGDKQEAYLRWKAELLAPLFGGAVSTMARVHPATGRQHGYARYQSATSPLLGDWRRLFYPHGGRKIIPAQLADILRSPASLAYWYMDDGYYSARDNMAWLYLGTVTLDEATIAHETICQNFDLAARLVDKKSKGFAISLSPTETAKLKRLVRGYMLRPLFDYKLPPDPVTTEGLAPEMDEPAA